MIERIFLAHPRSVDESYGEHFSVAFGFGAQMVTGGLACIVHAFIPALFERTASKTVKSLYGFMAARQPSGQKEPLTHMQDGWQLEYEI